MIRQLTIAVSVFVAASALGAYPDPDEQILRDAKIKRDDESLVKFLGRLSADEKDLSQRDELIRQLGTESFAERQKAIERLTAMGAAAVAHLQKATQTGSAEARKNAQKCLDAIQTLAPPGTPLAAVRLVIKRPSPGAVEALLRYLPSAADYEVQEEISFGLDNLTEKAKTIPPALRTVLTDANPARRAIAACILGHRGTPEDRTAVKKCLTDADATVRLRAAQGLLAAKEKDGIPTLIELLNGTAMDVAWQAEELLRYVAGKSSPKALVGNGEEKQRKACSEAWTAWWQANGATIDFENADKEHRRPGLVLCCDGKPGDGERAYFMLGCDGTLRFQKTTSDPSQNLVVLPSGSKSLERSVILDLQWSPCYARSRTVLRPDGIPIPKPAISPIYFPDYSYLLACGSRVIMFDHVGRILWAGFCDRDACVACCCLEICRIGLCGSEEKNFDLRGSPKYRIRCLMDRDPRVRASALDWLICELAMPFRGLIGGVPPTFRAVYSGKSQSIPQDEIADVSMFDALRAFSSRSPAVRAAALSRIGASDEPKLFAPVILDALRDPDPTVRARVGNCMHGFGGEGAVLVPALRAALKDPDARVRSEALVGLGYFPMEAKSALSEMIQVLRNEPDLSGWGMSAVGEVARGSADAVRELIAMLKRKESMLGAVVALARVGKDGREAVPLLVDLLDNLDRGPATEQAAFLRAGVVDMLRELGPDAILAVPALTKIVSDHSGDGGLCASAITALSRIGKPAKCAIPAISAACKANPVVRSVGLTALRILESE